LIAVLRDPIDRAHSNWAHLWSAGLETEGDFVRACSYEKQRAAAGWASFWQYLDLGRYGGQIQRALQSFAREDILLIRYRELRETPAETLDRVSTFLGVERGFIADVPAENVTTQASDSWPNRLVASALRAGHAVEHKLPEAWWPRIDGFLARHLQSEQRTRQPLTPDQRSALVPLIADDVALLASITGESFDEWVDPTWTGGNRSPLQPSGRIGTAHGSIDRPIPNADRG